MAQLIGTPHLGDIASAGLKTIGIQSAAADELLEPRQDAVNVEFVNEALIAKHPSAATNKLPEPMQDAVKFCLSHPVTYVAQHRSQVLRYMIAKAKHWKHQAMPLKNGMSQRRRQIPQRKNMHLFKKLTGAGRARLVVLGIDIGGRWSEETVTFIRLLANHKASSTPPSLRQSAALAWTSRWTALLATAAMGSFACSLLMLPASASTNVDGPPPPSVTF